jgi:hypothetical protein
MPERRHNRERLILDHITINFYSRPLHQWRFRLRHLHQAKITFSCKRKDQAARADGFDPGCFSPQKPSR